MTDKEVEIFQSTVWEYYRAYGRHDLPWRQPEADSSYDPYKIFVSEVMLQQTQVARVIPKFESFLQLFPTVKALAAAPLAEVLKAWGGLGYNRRAKFLWQAADMIVKKYRGQVPDKHIELLQLSGIGPNTAGAVLAYSYNKPAVFIETNIRTVFIHHFFADQKQISDKEIMKFVEKTLPDHQPGRAAREWYWALMDYGVYVKQSVGNLNKLSKHYTKQSAFAGSKRQIRGHVLRLLSSGSQTLEQIKRIISDERLEAVLEDLQSEGFIDMSGDYYKLAAV